SGARLDTAFTGGQKEAGRHLLYGSGNDAQRTLLAARLPVIALTLLFGLVVFAFARDLAGAPGGIAALALYAFSPDVIAHGSLATLDVPMAGFLLTAAWLLWRARRRPRLHLPLAGAALGAALATKMSALPAIPVLLGLAALAVWTSSVRGSGRPRAPSGRPDGPSRRRLLAVCAASAAGVAVVAVAVVWASYLAADPRLRWRAPAGGPPSAGPRGLCAARRRFPGRSRAGRAVRFAFGARGGTGFLFGEVYKGSRWYYLPAALLVKTPLGTLA